MKNIWRILIICAAFLNTGCTTHLGQDYFEHYIVEYAEIAYSLPSTPRIVTYDKTISIHLGPCLTTYATQLPSNQDDYSLYEEKLDKKHHELSERYNDIGFNRWEDITWLPCLLAFPMSINIVSGADYDPQHPAGSSLADIVKIHYVTHKPFVDNGYRHTDGSRAYNDYTGERCNKLLSDFTLDDSILIEEEFQLEFEVAPTLSQQHEFTISVLPENKEEPFTFTATMNFSTDN